MIQLYILLFTPVSTISPYALFDCLCKSLFSLSLECLIGWIAESALRFCGPNLVDVKLHSSVWSWQRLLLVRHRGTLLLDYFRRLWTLFESYCFWWVKADFVDVLKLLIHLIKLLVDILVKGHELLVFLVLTSKTFFLFLHSKSINSRLWQYLLLWKEFHPHLSWWLWQINQRSELYIGLELVNLLVCHQSRLFTHFQRLELNRQFHGFWRLWRASAILRRIWLDWVNIARKIIWNWHYSTHLGNSSFLLDVHFNQICILPREKVTLSFVFLRWSNTYFASIVYSKFISHRQNIQISLNFTLSRLLRHWIKFLDCFYFFRLWKSLNWIKCGCFVLRLA